MIKIAKIIKVVNIISFIFQVDNLFNVCLLTINLNINQNDILFLTIKLNKYKSEWYLVLYNPICWFIGDLVGLKSNL